LALTVLLGYNFIGAQWANPPAGTPPANNVEAPINTSATSQIKLGALGTGPLSITGSALLTSTWPSVSFRDTDGRQFWQVSEANNFYLLADRNRDGSISGPDLPYPLIQVTGDTSVSDYVQFSNKVYASEYCDRNGGNCFTANVVGGVAPGSGNTNSGNKDCAALPVCGSAADTNSAQDCRVSGGTHQYSGQALCVARTNVTGLLSWGEALDACRVMYGSGYHVPTESELNALYVQRTQIGGFGSQGGSWPSYFWSSTDSNSMDGQSTAKLMTTGVNANFFTTREIQVRCVRGDLL
ncbi:MAG: hypothetical protein RLZZ70_82, partial [Candidatus Parcubacteria bacterium]